MVAAASLLILIAARWYKSPYPGINYSYSIFILVNFLGSSLALVKKNAYPSIAFVGDTYCYFAGIVIAISSMLSNSS